MIRGKKRGARALERRRGGEARTEEETDHFFCRRGTVELSGSGIKLQTGEAEKLKFKYFKSAPLQNVPTTMDAQVRGKQQKQEIGEDARVDSDATATGNKA